VSLGRADEVSFGVSFCARRRGAERRVGRGCGVRAAFRARGSCLVSTGNFGTGALRIGASNPLAQWEAAGEPCCMTKRRSRRRTTGQPVRRLSEAEWRDAVRHSLLTLRDAAVDLRREIERALELPVAFRPAATSTCQLCDASLQRFAPLLATALGTASSSERAIDSCFLSPWPHPLPPSAIQEDAKPLRTRSRKVTTGRERFSPACPLPVWSCGTR